MGYLLNGLKSASAMVRSTHSTAYASLLGAIVAARKSAGLRQVELALRLGKPQSYVSKVENGERRIDPVEYLEIMRAIGVSGSKTLAEIEAEMFGDYKFDRLPPT